MPIFRSANGLPDGLYERVVSTELDAALTHARAGGRVTSMSPLDHSGSSGHLIYAVADALSIALSSLQTPEQLLLTNELLARIAGASAGALTAPETTLIDQLLLAVETPQPLAEPRELARPATSLVRSELLVNAERRSVVAELLSEIDSADEIDLLCSFVKWSGFLKFREALTRHCARGRRLRVLTTTYLGATDAEAVEGLRKLGATVKVSYDGETTRLHAKAWLFSRRSGYSTAYVGSSNLSAAALTDGLEWNVRVTNVDAPQILDRFRDVFDSYWDDPQLGFEPYSPERAEQLRAALQRARGVPRASSELPLTFELTPWSFQREILERLEAARAHGRTRNLVVAATGTGKTVVAALDYRRLRAAGKAERLLFVAHRKEILSQSRRLFAYALKQPDFGELLVDGEVPREGKHVFASIQSLGSALDRRAPAPDAFDMIIIDEVHHAAAKTYERILNHFRPRVLLGLTATPERADGLQLDKYFDVPYAAELRVWDAIDQQILVPFNYFGIADGTDLSHVAWKRGRYQTDELSRTLIGSDKIWVERLISAIERYVPRPGQMRALAFCVDMAHANHVAERLRARGFRAEALTSDSSDELRRSATGRLRSGGDDRLNVLCTVDLFNEGVDIPEIDTVFFLRPTESATVFLQQLGRGLRRADAKDSLLVLDFIGRQQQRFRFDVRYRALLGLTRRELRASLEHGFGRLPSGCSLQLEREALAEVLASVRRALPSTRKALVERLRELRSETTLAEYLKECELELEELYDDKWSWNRLQREAGRPSPTPVDATESAALEHAMYLSHVDDDARLECWLRFCDAPNLTPSDYERRLLQMLFVLLYGMELASDFDAALASWRTHLALRAEVRALASCLRERSLLVPRALTLPVEVPLVGHAHYRVEELLAAYDQRSSEGKFYRPQQGIFTVSSLDHDLLLITLDKSGKSKVPHLQYADRALSPREFHWESQAKTRLDSKMGRRHVDHEQQGIVPVLLVREAPRDERGLAMAYQLLGPARCIRHEKERPISIVWALETEMPAALWREAKATVG